MYVKNEVIELINNSEKEVKEELEKVDKICEVNTLKVLQAFQDNNLSEIHFNQTTGYGYDDIGREVIEKIYSQVFGTEDSLVRGQFISGSHALTVTLFALLRPGDLLLSISGKPYDTLDEVIGIKDNPSSLKSFGIKYEQIDLINDDFDYEKIEERISKGNVKVIEIQRSRGYSTRKSILIGKYLLPLIDQDYELIKEIDKNNENSFKR